MINRVDPDRARGRRYQTGTEVLARQREVPSRRLEQQTQIRYGGGNSPVRHQVVVTPDDHGKVAVWDREGYLAVGAAGLSGVIISATPPLDPTDGQLWWDSVDGQLYIWYDDGTSAQWVIADGRSGGGFAGVVTGVQPPANPADGQLWWDAVGGALYIFYNDGTSAQWVRADPCSGGAGVVTSVQPPADPVDGQLWWNAQSGALYVFYNDGTSRQWVGITC